MAKAAAKVRAASLFARPNAVRSSTGAIRRRIPRGLLAVCIGAEILIVAPVLVTIDQAISGGWHAALRDLTRAAIPTLLLHTLVVAAIVTPLCGVIGLAGAWAVERTRLAGRRIWMVLLVAPITVPAFVTSYAWVSVSSSMQGLAGAVAVTTFTYYPLVFLISSAALRGLDPALEESARSLGSRPWTVFRRVALPQLRPALLGGMLLVALDALVEFDAFAALKFQTFSTDVYSQYQSSFSVSSAAVLSMLSLGLCLLLLGGEAFLRGGASYTRVSMGARRPPSLYPLGRTAPLVHGGLGLLATAAVGVPVGILVYWFTQASSSALAAAAAGMGYLLPAAVTSIGLGIGGAVLALLLALPIAYAITRYRGRWIGAIERGSYLSYALPDLVGAIALGYAALHWVRPLYESLALLVVAYAILFVPLAVVALRTTLSQIEPRMDECARSLGAGTFATAWRVTLPVARPGLAAAGVLVFAFVLGDLSTTQVLLPPGMYTLGTQFWTNSSTVAFAAAAPYAAVLMTLALGCTFLLMGKFGRIRALAAPR